MGLTHSPIGPSDGLVLCLDTANRRSYPGSGTNWFDLSGNGNHGVLTNGPTLKAGPGGGMSFDGVNGQLIVPSNGLRVTQSHFVSMWVRWKTITIANSPTIWSLSDITYPFATQINAGINTIGHGVSNNTSRFTVNAYNATLATGVWGSAYTATTFATRLNEWIHFAFGWGGNTWHIYVNGVRDTVVDGTGGPMAMSSSSPIYIGSILANRFADANIDDIRLYNRALTPTEIRQLFEIKRRRYL